MIIKKILKNCIYYQKTLKLSPLNRQMRVCAQCGTKKAAQMLVSQLSGHLKRIPFKCPIFVPANKSRHQPEFCANLNCLKF